ncbi:MAG: TIGR03960 family B12-binding radical SAM protein [Syntrophomonadaceae bacterium]|nr:TIGR03960 family B12-binding radical SAM protein [Syntrophomonadaceae bacterium]MDD3890542.1 TIGR03960 family B12-binding radical SAM protein [Syntrophomonadaceae bacterium]
MKDRLFKDILPQVSKPARYTGNELNMIKKDWAKCRCKMAFAFPDVYEVGMSHIGGKILYGLVNETSNHLIERVFAPWPDMEDIMRKERIPLFSLESFRPLTDFDVVGFSLQYELSITNVLNMLDMAGIPVWSEDRDEKYPLVIAGGPVVFNPEPYADFFDAFLIGDGEEVLLEFLDCYDQNQDIPRQDLLIKLAQIEGVYVPSLYTVEYNADNTFRAIEPRYPEVPTRVKKRVIKSLDTAYYPDKPILPYMEIIHDRAVLEVMRGCQRGCRFCHAGIVYRPVRERSIDTLKRQARAQLENTGYEEISLASLSTLDYTGVNKLVKELVEEYGDKGIGVSLPSLRVDAFSIDLANEVQKVRKTTLTLAPEAGTQRLRDVINKNVTDEQLFRAVEAAFKSGWLSVKLYFMIGLPSETLEDLDGILELLQKVKAIGDNYARKPVEVRASLASFVPKAHTPFQWYAQDSSAEVEEKQHHMMKSRKKRIKVSFHDSQTSYLEGVMARGDRQLSKAIFRAWSKGCKFDGWSEYFRSDWWAEAMQESGIDPDFYTHRSRSYDEVFPWDFIDIGVNKDFLQRENEKALQVTTSPDCRVEGCSGCGICPNFEVDLDIRGAN